MFPSYVVNSANKVLSSTNLGKTVHLDMAIVETQFNNVPSYSGVTQAAWHIVNGCDVPTCAMCDKPAKFLTGKRKYWSWCSNKCMGKDPAILAKKQETNIERHGDPHPQRLDWVKQKQGDTLEQKYGYRNAFQVPEIQERMRAGWVEKYGVDNPSKSEDIQDVISEKGLARDQDAVNEKRIKTNMKKFGAPSASGAHISPEARACFESFEWMYDNYVIQEKSTYEIGRELGYSGEHVATKLKSYGFTIRATQESQCERDIAAFLRQYTAVEQHNWDMISPKELDIVCHDLKIAVEVNGVYYHTKKDDQYHLWKSTECNKLGYRLFHISDVDWEYRNDAVKTLLLKITNQLTETPFTGLRMRFAAHKEAEEFFKNNYFTDLIHGEYYPAVYDGDEIIAIASVVDGVVEQYCEKVYTTLEDGLNNIILFLMDVFEVTIGYSSNQNYPVIETCYEKKTSFSSATFRQPVRAFT